MPVPSGAVWECPLLAQLTPLPPGGVRTARAAAKHLVSLLPADNGPLQQLLLACSKRGGSGDGSDAFGANVNAVNNAAGCNGKTAMTKVANGFIAPATAAATGCALDLTAAGVGALGLVDARLPQTQEEAYSHFYSISPDACTNPTLYWLGR